MFRSIRWTLQLWHAGILLLALCSFGTALYVVMSHSEYARLDTDLEEELRGLVSFPRGPGGGGGGGPGGPGGGPPTWQRGMNGPATGPAFAGPGVGGPGIAPGEFNGNNPGGRGSSAAPTTAPSMGATFGLLPPGGPGGPGGPDQHDRPPPPQQRQQNPWWANIPQDALRRIGQNEQEPYYFVIWGREGAMVRSSASLETLAEGAVPFPAITWKPADRTPQFRTRNQLREVIMPAFGNDRVLVGRSMLGLQERLIHLQWTLLGSGLSVLAIGLVGGWLLSERATRPIRLISQTAQSISASDLSQRIAVEETQSELGGLAQTLNETFGRLETAFARQVRFTADASHELRTPLSVIHSHTELALTRDRTAPEYRQTIETCLRASRRMKSLVEALLVLARADAGRLELRCEKFDLKEAAEECVAMAASQARDANVRMESDLRSIPIEADRIRLCQLMTNLLSNGIRYNREGGSVRLSINSVDGDAVIAVADTGVGIAAEDQPRIFERFFRTDKARSREAGGSGLGLAICQSIVEAHAGKITFTSQAGVGTTFTARVPRIRAEAEMKG